jgi:hypothetical protein
VTVPTISPASAFGTLPETLRDALLNEFNKIVRNFREKRWEPAELDAGRLCEIVYSIVHGYVSGTMPASASKPPNMVAVCRALEQGPTTALPGDRSVRILIPRTLVALYEVRNNRGVGHVGGDVNANHADATVVLYGAKWLMAELVRIFHSVSLDEATAVVESLIARVSPVVWDIAGVKRVLTAGRTMKEKTLILLYEVGGTASTVDLVKWTEHSNVAAYRRDVLRALHKDRLIEYDTAAGLVHLSPLGIDQVDQKKLLF